MLLQTGKLYFLNNGEEYKELGSIENVEITPVEEDSTEMKDITSKMENYNGELQIDIRARKTIREIKRLFKTDIQRKSERRYNKRTFRDFIRKKR